MSKVVRYTDQIPRASLFWLLLAQVAVVLPHLGGLPNWLFVVCALCGAWRLAIYRSLLPFAPAAVRVLLVAAGLWAVAASYGARISLDPAVALLVLAFFFKLLETRTRRDMYVAIFLGYYVGATQLLFSQSLVATLYATACCGLFTVSLLALHQPRNFSMRLPVLRALQLLLQTGPVLVVLFLFFPRVPPFWAVPMPSGGKTSGVSDSIRPDDFRSLASSSATAFRVSFDGPVPPAARLYWRGLVFTRFDGTAWRIPARDERARLARDAPDYRRDGAPLHYTVIMEPTQQHWLFALPMATTDSSGVHSNGLGTVYSSDRLRTRERLRFARWPYRQFDANLSADERARMTALPATGNPRARALAKRLRQRYSDDGALVAAMLRRFGDGDYRYTLNPPAVTGDAIDVLLFDTRAGYCEHYASAFAFVMRAAGIPARVIGGYQGGERNPYEQFLTVRELDAHAWVEVWLPGKGWVREDPTAVVAPERIRLGAEQLLRQRRELNTGSLFGAFSYDDIAWLKSVRLWWDAVNYGWSQWFLGYDNRAQLAWLGRWFGSATAAGLSRALGFGFAISVVLLGLWNSRGWWRMRRQPGAFALAFALGATAALDGPRRPPETVASYCRRVGARHTVLAGRLDELARLEVAIRYGGRAYTVRQRLALWSGALNIAVTALLLRIRTLVR